MDNYLKINIIGDSMVGKTSFICNLLKDEQCKILESIASRNKTDGQTKIKTRYFIGNYKEAVIKKAKVYKSIVEIFKSKYIINSINNDENDDDINTLNINIGQDKLEEFYSEFINNNNYKEEIICIDIEVPAREEIFELMKKNDYSQIIIIDTRGFDDGIRDDLNKYADIKERWTNEKNKGYEILVADRGIIESDITIVYTNNCGLRLVTDKELYKNFLVEAIRSKPLVVISRSSLLTEKQEEEKIDYYELINEIDSIDNKDKIFNGKLKYEHCFKSTVDLFNLIRKDTKLDSKYYNYIIDRIKYLLIPDVADLSKNKELYRNDQEIILFEIFKYYKEYRAEIASVSNKFKDNNYIQKIIENLKNEILKYLNKEAFTIKNKQDDILKRLQIKYYKNNFVGSKGGITTCGGQPILAIIIPVYDAIKISINRLSVDNDVKRFMIGKLDSYDTMMDYTVSFGNKVKRNICESFYNKLNIKNNITYDKMIEELVDISLNTYKNCLTDNI